MDGYVGDVTPPAPRARPGPERPGAYADHGDPVLAATANRSADAFRAGIEAYVWGYPLVVMARTRAQFLATTPANTFSHQRQLASPESKAVVTPNNDTLYSIAWLDLRSGPVVLRLPAVPERYYDFQFLDMYTDTFANVCVRLHGPGPGAYAVVGPEWSGSLPDGVGRLDAPTPDVWVIGRTLVDGPADVDAVRALQDRYQLQSLPGPPAAPPPPAPPPTTAPLPSPHQVATAGIGFFDELGAAMTADPPPPHQHSMVQALASAGIGPGLSPRTGGDRSVQSALVQSIPTAETVIATATSASIRTDHGWASNPMVGTYGTDYLARATTAKIGLGANVADEAVYYATVADVTGAPLTGQHTYRIEFAAGQLPPVHRHGFWSVTVYGPDRFLVANALHRYSIGDRTAGLKTGDDGSLRIVLGTHSPAAHHANWLPTPPGPFTLVLRVYVPAPPVLGGTWAPPGVTPEP